jgi:hypothetical protein
MSGGRGAQSLNEQTDESHLKTVYKESSATLNSERNLFPRKKSLTKICPELKTITVYLHIPSFYFCCNVNIPGKRGGIKGPTE